MKKILILVLAFVFLSAIFPAVYAETADAPVRFVTDKVTVVVRGDAGIEYAGQNVSLLLLKGEMTPSQITSKEDILGIDGTQADANGKYEFEVGLRGIAFDAGKMSDGHLFIRAGDQNITDTVVEAYTEAAKQFFADMKVITNESGRRANLVVRAPENFVDEVTLLVGQYDACNRLVGVSMPEGTIQNGGADISASLVPDENAAYCRAFGWYKSMVPISKAITAEKLPQKVLMIGNSFSVDSARYVHQLARSMGIELEVHMYQTSGATVQQLFDERAGTTDTSGWYYSKNYDEQEFSSIAEGRNPTLDAFLSTESMDAVILQNYWGESNDIQYYTTEQCQTGTCKKKCVIPSPHYVTMAEYIREKQPNAQIIINSIWSNEDGYYFSDYVKNNFGLLGFENASAYMYDLIEKHNGQSAIDIGAASVNGTDTTIGVQGGAIKQLPVGYAMQYARNWQNDAGIHKFFTTYEEGAYTDPDGDGIYDFPQEDGKIRLHRDGYHLSQAGRYLAGCVWIETLTGLDVRKASFCPGPEELTMSTLQGTATTDKGKVRFLGINAEDGALIRQIAHEAVEKFNAQNVRGLTAPPLSFETRK